jgi:hypothetical protein
VYYKTDGVRVETFVDQAEGRMLAVGVGPSSADHDAGFTSLAQMILEMLAASDPAAFAAPVTSEPLDEVAVAATQNKAVNDLLLRAGGLPQDTLEPYRRTLARQMPDTWPSLEEDVRTILVTAEYFGASAPDGADLSGPLLGLSAACERLLCGTGTLFDRVASQAGGILRTPTTLGAAAMCLKWCRKPNEAKHRTIQTLVHADQAVDYATLLDLGEDLSELNDYRKAAAHIELVSQDDYTRGRALILGSGDQATLGLLTRLVQALGLR